ncbi:molybdopterin-dependent oxidoreductase [Neorhizobium petrolearium]|uniref:molybdopterin-dependent oxidoreductase n=1 Tax=Neorhizobium petrolearium TaxID=515361 RepID=UPI003F5CC3AC
MTRDKTTEQRPDTLHYIHASGGWGSLRGIEHILLDQKPTFRALRTLFRQNKPGGHMCTSCAWTKPPEPHPFEFCENGAKATIWDLTSKRCTPDFFAEKTVSELRTWSDHDLEEAGRLTHPMRYNPQTDHYEACTWDQAFSAIGAKLRELEPRSTVFYTSGKAALETAYLFQLFARLYGHNNLPDSSNMCHETTSVGLKKVTGSSVGACVFSDFDHCDLILFFGQNTGSNSPSFLHKLQETVERGGRIITFNPLRETGLLEFVNPQRPTQMTVMPATPLSEIYLQVRPGGDIAALAGLCKHLFELEHSQGGIIDWAFVREHTNGTQELEAVLRELDWEEIEHTLSTNPKVRWDDWTGDYSLIRNLFELSYPEKFKDFNKRLFTPGGFYRGNAARERLWKTESGKAECTAPDVLSALGKMPEGDEVTLITLRSNDQFNTTIYGFRDRLRGLEGSRHILLINPDEMARRGLQEGQVVALKSTVEDGVKRSVSGLKVTAYDLPDTCVGAYYSGSKPFGTVELPRPSFQDACIQGSTSSDRHIVRRPI